MGNRLAAETSPYLLQHRDNPVHWWPWGEEALGEARERDVPVLLSVGYSACHWCHVMERESFEDEGTAAFMNENFVNVKVDREERPDVDALYMEAVQSMTGHGGWPMTVFLDPDGVPFYGGTYFPPEPRSGMPSFVQVMQAVISAFRERREEIRARAPRTRAQLGALGELEAQAGAVEPGVLTAAEEGLLRRADPVRGGFGGAPKFPPASALEFLLGRGGPEATAVVERTLERMAAGGIYDHVGGGFARYSVDDEWLVPHFEKMLYDNALLARAYLHGWQVSGRDRYRAVCEETLDWALREMWGPEGGFFSALDADSEGEEGRFYVWDADEIRELLGADAEAFCAYYGVTDPGNFEGRNILHVPAGGPEPPAGLEGMRRRLYEVRSERVWPGLDDKRLTSWNALMIAALADAGAVLASEQYLDAARATASFVLDELRDDEGRLLRTYKDGRAHLNAYLEDHAFLLEGLLALYEATFESRWYDEAVRIADAMIERFADPQRGGFFSTSSDHEKLIARRKDLGDHPIPAGNSAAALGLLRLHALSGEGRYEQAALGVLRLFAPAAPRHPDGFGHLLQALDFHLSGSRELALLAPEGDEPSSLGPMLEVVRSAHRPRLTLAAGSEGAETPPLLRDRPAAGGRTAAYLCERFTCQAPVTEPGELAALLDG